MILCLCKGVSDRVVRLAVATGATTIDGVAARCGAGTDCGACRHAIRDLIQDMHQSAATSAQGVVERACCENESGATAPVAASAGV
jgi:bacterioferritin-associated ferredoxin